ncbi:hypothetical protein AXK12_05535 [Cephaloticoccus capnophilus]|uniref:Uncharacterized protein n=1 Tax=Cephaloticoccus capnophilus TaxID=1548208 RepID=A0A139SL69_9BACT|nr:hypothetical protein [Cephaloticoccus capnophilus]KXU35309.1 hypothetical protein AXK12_05535 [Cephaloticoccus capnophilus]
MSGGSKRVGPRPEDSPRRLWGAALAVAALALLLLLGLLSLNLGGELEPSEVARTAPSRNRAAQPVGLQPIRSQQSPHGESDLVAAEALFFDPSPLFLPTRWNAGAVDMPETILQEAEELFEDYAPQLSFAREGIGSGLLGNTDSAELRAAELVFSDEDGVGLSVIGRGAEEPARLPERSGRLEVRETATARRVVVRDLVPPTTPAGAANWQPLELAAVIDAAGLVGPVTLVHSSGVEAVDEFFRDYVVSGLHLGERVGPGVYQILAGP